MTETEWLSCTDTGDLLAHLESVLSRRKLFLFVCACERRLWHHPDCDREKIEVLERYADGQAPAADVLDVLTGIDGMTLAFVEEDMGTADWAAYESEDSAEFAANIAQQGREWEDLEDELEWKRYYTAEQGEQCLLLRDIAGNPFRPVVLDPAWLTAHVVAVARAIYDDRRFAEMPILADALEDAGCSNADVLAHCRQPGAHARGCWLLDLLLGKQ